MLHLFYNLDFFNTVLVFTAFLFVLIYEAINGFHDTANAIATVIYTKAIKSSIAVIIAGIFNFIGVIFGGLSVAYAIVHLLPNKILMSINSIHSLSMIFSILLAAIFWNLGTWYFGLPSSSSHSLIGSIIGIAFTNAIINKTSLIDALNIHKVIEIFVSLIISPMLGLIISGMLIIFLRRFLRYRKYSEIHMTPAIYEKTNGKKTPPFWTRLILIFSSIGVSYSHGANDGQKGIGLIMLVLISVAPASFIVNINASSYDIEKTKNAISFLEVHHNDFLKKENLYCTSSSKKNVFSHSQKNIITTITESKFLLNKLESYKQLNVNQRIQIYRFLICISSVVDKIIKLSPMNLDEKKFLYTIKLDLLKTIEYAPNWIILIIGISLSIGTMIGWKRVAKTISAKIGKKEMTYAQGMCAQTTAALSIYTASYIGMPVSTPHILSSSIAGSMLADGSGIQNKTIKNILLAWMLTIPISMLLSSILYCVINIFIF